MLSNTLFCKKNGLNDYILRIDSQEYDFLTKKSLFRSLPHSVTPSNRQYEDFNKKFMDTLKMICQNTDKNYVEDSLSNISLDYDILVLKRKQQPAPVPIKWSNNENTELISQIDGFIIAELGECKMKPNVWSVRLICSKGGIGKLLLGAFMYCIKNSSEYEKEGILELLSGYLNLPGFLSYTKMGFVKNLYLFQGYSIIPKINCFTKCETRCFNNIICLPMSVYLSRITNEEIINRALGVITFIIEDESGLYQNRLNSRDVNFKMLQLYNNILYKLECIHNNNNELLELIVEKILIDDEYAVIFMDIGRFPYTPTQRKELIKKLNSKKEEILQGYGGIPSRSIFQRVFGKKEKIDGGKKYKKSKKNVNRRYTNSKKIYKVNRKTQRKNDNPLLE